MTKRLLTILWLIPLIVVATLIVVQHQTGRRLREGIGSLQQKAGELPRLRAENKRLSNLVARTGGTQSLSPDQSRELLRLRAEAGRLRRENREVRAALSTPDNASGSKTSSEADAPEEHPRESWTFAGRATPEAALESYYWAISNGDLGTLQAAMSPEGWKQLQDELKEEQEAQRETGADVAAVFSKHFSKLKGFHILSRDTISETDVSFKVAYSGMAGATSHRFRKVGDEWKMVQEEEE